MFLAAEQISVSGSELKQIHGKKWEKNKKETPISSHQITSLLICKKLNMLNFCFIKVTLLRFLSLEISVFENEWLLASVLYCVPADVSIG